MVTKPLQRRPKYCRLILRWGAEKCSVLAGCFNKCWRCSGALRMLGLISLTSWVSRLSTVSLLTVFAPVAPGTGADWFSEVGNTDALVITWVVPAGRPLVVSYLVRVQRFPLKIDACFAIDDQALNCSVQTYQDARLHRDAVQVSVMFIN